MDHTAVIREFIIDNFLFGEGALSEDTDLFKKQIIDSTGILEVVSFLEERFGLKIVDDEMLPSNFSSLGNLSRFVASKMEATPSRPAGAAPRS